MTVPYTTKTGLKQYKPAFKWIEDAISRDDGLGFCLGCGDEQTGCEPDARRYTCEGCGAAKIYGAEELALMGLFHHAD